VRRIRHQPRAMLREPAQIVLQLILPERMRRMHHVPQPAQRRRLNQREARRNVCLRLKCLPRGHRHQMHELLSGYLLLICPQMVDHLQRRRALRAARQILYVPAHPGQHKHRHQHRARQGLKPQR
jgi:hypothetical protein